PVSLGGELRSNGYYDPVKYRFWGYPKKTRNLQEERPATLTGSTGVATNWKYDQLPAQHLRPRYLCVLRDYMPAHEKYTGFNKVIVKQWVSDFPDRALEYIVVSYTREHFMTSDEKSLSKKAARDAGVPAFYIDFMCMDDETFQEDIHRICDVVRGAHSLVIALNEPVNNRLRTVDRLKKTSRIELDERSLLRAWGARMWTVSEVLLCSDEHRIAVYRHGDLTRPKIYAKRNFAVEAYNDPRDIRQLIDHYEGSLILTPLELVTIGLECLQSRLNQMINNGYSTWSAGDMSYALMAMLRRRPHVNPQDSAFEAFAKLSLANDSNKLLERLICMLPPEINSPWHDMQDIWGAKLWDIDPRCQVAGIAENQTVILDGAYAATIQWHSLAPVAFIKRATFWRTVLKFSIRTSPAFLATTIGLLAIGSRHATLNGTEVAGIFMLLFTAILVLASPYILLLSYKGKLWSTQAELFGTEGVADISLVERFLFGFDHKRLKWSTHSSLLSRHRPNSHDECIPFPPDTATMQLLPEQRLFTLIDTYTMTATVFASERPSTTVMICGSEGGLQRAVLCSYEWQTQTFKRDGVLRMKTMV
ncbi:hypothetical protein N431DRAFT_333129, partial [Stipitochalara longipes BDJ]